MLINVDASHLDWTCAVYLAQDQKGMEEINGKFDIHTDNQKVFGLPSRLIAKIFLFRIIFGGTAFSFANDPDFDECRFNVKQWEEVIERFYTKYKGIREWHTALITQAQKTGIISIPTGRQWEFKPTPNSRTGEYKWPITTIKNYPVQGLEADLMALARVSLYNRIKKYGNNRIKLVSTVHDSILLDVPSGEIGWTCRTIQSVFDDVPRNFSKFFGVDFNLPFRGEIKIGMDYLNMEEYNDSI